MGGDDGHHLSVSLLFIGFHTFIPWEHPFRDKNRIWLDFCSLWDIKRLQVMERIKNLYTNIHRVKMKKSQLIVTIFFLFISLNTWAQVDKGVELFLLEDYEEAQKAFEESVAGDPDISYYYLGEIALQRNNSEEAANYYEKGIATNNEAVLCRIGKTKLELKSNPEELRKNIKAITNKNKKKVRVLLAAAQAYLDGNLPDEAAGVLSMARNADKTDPYIYIFEGDLLKAKGEPGDAATQYEQATNFDPACVIAYIKSSTVYESIAPTTAINTLKNGLETNPENPLLRKYLARSYYRNGFYEQAIAEYETLHNGEARAPEDRRNYAASLYFAGKYNDALAALLQITSIDPNHPVVNRLLMYTYDKLKNFDEVVATGRKFFSLSTNGEAINYLVTDYTVFADALLSKGEIEEAIEAYKKAIAIEPEQGSLNKDVATKLASIDRIADAADFYQKYIEATSSKDASDYLQLGIYYYRTAVKFVAKAKTEPTEKNQPEMETSLAMMKDSMAQYVSKADEAFAKVIELAPDSYQGYYWRANANTLLDPDLSKGLANDDYLKMIELLVASEDKDNQGKLIEAYRYFSIYYLYQFDANKQADNKKKAKEYVNKVLQLKPDDDTSLKIIEVLNN